MRLNMALSLLILLAGMNNACSERKQEQSETPTAKENGPAETPPPAPAQMRLDETEPNDKTDQATEIGQGCIVSAKLEAAPGAKKRALDWYRFSPANKAVISVQVSAVAGEDIDLTFLDAGKNELFRVDAAPAGEAEGFPNLSIGSSAYLRVRGSAGGAGGDYLLTVTMAEPQSGHEVEFNGRYSTATALAAGQRVEGFLGMPRDEDWYLLPTTDMTKTTVMRIDLTAVEGVRPTLEVRDLERRLLLETSAEALGQGLVVRNLGLAEGTESIFLVVKSAWVAGPKPKKLIKTANSKQRYSLSTSFEEGGDDLEREPNDKAEQAFAVIDGQKVRGYLSAAHDVDWYKIEVERPSLLSVELSALDRVDLRLYVVDPEKKDAKRNFEILRIDDGGVNEAEVLTNCALKPGTNYLRVEGSWKKVDGQWVRDFVNLDETYQLSLGLRTDDGREEREPNRKPEWATPIQVGDTLRGTLHPKGDLDTYLLDLSAQDGPRDTVIECTGIAKLDIALALLGPEKDEDGRHKVEVKSNQGRGDAREQVEKELMPGQYYITVHGSPRTESNTQDQYLLTVTQP